MDKDQDIEHEDLEMMAEEIMELPDEDRKLKVMKEKLKLCESDKKEYLDGWQRTKADLVNYKKDEAKRLEDLGRFITGSMLNDLLPVLDSFEFALKSFQGAGGAMAQQEQGVLMIRSQMLDMLKKRGVEPIKVDLSEAFNPERHEALGEIESDTPAGTIAEEVQKGYTLAGRVLRPARVRLAKG